MTEQTSTEVVGIYARVSSESGEIASQVDALQQKVRADGFTLLSDDCFLDDGYSGDTLLRPGLERLRDRLAAGGLDRLYILAPDRLARNFVHQILLLEEFKRHGVEVVFLNRPLSNSSEDVLLGQIQAAVAEYERTRILERSRRGRLHAARSGCVSVLAAAPYGYRYIDKHAGGGKARYEVVIEQSAVVEQIFAWVGLERWTLRQVCRRLRELKIPSPSGRPSWSAKTLLFLLRNPAYKGQAGYGRSQVVQRRRRLRAARGQPEIPRRVRSVVSTPERAIPIPVPALVSEPLFAAVATQLEENKRRQGQRREGCQGKYLLTGLVECVKCKYAYHGCPGGPRKDRKGNKYIYYRCGGGNRSHFGGERVCDNRGIRGDQLEEAVWQDVRALLLDPGLIEREYERREGEREDRPSEAALWRSNKIKVLQKKLERLIDAYTEGLLTKEEFATRSEGYRGDLARLREEDQHEQEQQRQLADLRLVLGCLDEFAQQVRANLDDLDRSTRRQIIQRLVRKIVISDEEISIIFRVDLPPFDGSPTRGILQHCYRLEAVRAENRLKAELPTRTFLAF